MTAIFNQPSVMLRRKQVEVRTGLSRSTIYDKLCPQSPRFDPTFPKSIRLGSNMVAWVESEIEEWLKKKIADSRLQ